MCSGTRLVPGRYKELLHELSCNLFRTTSNPTWRSRASTRPATAYLHPSVEVGSFTRQTQTARALRAPVKAQEFARPRCKVAVKLRRFSAHKAMMLMPLVNREGSEIPHHHCADLCVLRPIWRSQAYPVQI